jgi:hypothetical protein
MTSEPDPTRSEPLPTAEAELLAARAEITRLTAELARAEAQAEREFEQLKDLRRSASWRITAPLRLLRYRARRGVDDVRGRGR